jgi:glycosyltransferase 2 family protein
MFERLRPWLPWLKLLFTVAILVGVVVLFWRAIDNDDLRRADPTRPPWHVLGDQVAAARPSDLVAAALLYLLGLSCCWAFWVGLLGRWGARLDFWPGLRAYVLSHLGKYAPLGKGWALVLRVTLAAQAGVRTGLAALSGAYETLTMMAAGALVAAVLFTVLPGDPRQRWQALGLFLLALLPIIPGVFNWVVRRLARRFVRGDALPVLGVRTLGAGLALTSCCWILFGLSLAAVLRSLDANPGSFDLDHVSKCIAIVAVSYVAGFLASTPGGLGVREVLMQQFLAPELGNARAVVVVILLRLLWTGAELVAAGLLYWAPARNRVVGLGPPAFVASASVMDLAPTTGQPPP